MYIGMDRVVRVGATTRLWWQAPGYSGLALPAGNIFYAPPGITYRAPSGVVSASLAPAQTSGATVTAATRDVLTLSAPLTTMAGTLDLGDAWLYTVAGGALPVRIASVSGATVRLVDRLPYDPIITADSRLQSGLWYHDVGPGSPVDVVTRDASGDMPVPYTIGWGAASPGAVGVDVAGIEGLLSVVRQPFATGLTSAGLLARWPELRGFAQVGSSALGPAIMRTHEALALRVRQDVRERGSYAWEDDLSGSTFAPAHAALAAASLLDAVAPERAALLREQSEPLYTQALASAWHDANRNGVVDPGESPGLTGTLLAGDQLASVSGRNPWARPL